MASGTEPLPRQGQVQVRFVTTEKDIELSEEKRLLLVPTDVRRYGLSQILNSESMLDTPRPIPFDFLVNGAFLRGTLDEYLTSKGLSSENTLTLQYVRSLVPPIWQSSFQQDDTVTCVDVVSSSSPAGLWDPEYAAEPGKELIVSGSADDLLRVWDKDGREVATATSPFSGGVLPGVKTVKFITPTQIVAGYLDSTVRVWDIYERTLKPILELDGHHASVNNLAVHGPTSRILTASQDACVGLWSTKKGDDITGEPEGTEPVYKRRKLLPATPKGGHVSIIMLYKGSELSCEPVTGVIFHPDDPSVAYCTSQDHALRTIDLTTSTTVDTRTTLHPLMCLTAMPSVGTSHILATGSTARHILLMDPRLSTARTAIMTLRGHTNYVTSLSPAPDSPYGLVSASADGTCRVWDIRNTRSGSRDEGGGTVGESIYIIDRETLKGRRYPVSGSGYHIWDVVWDRDVGIVSGGEDKRVQINKGTFTKMGEVSE